MQAARNHPRCGGRDARFVGNGAISAVGFARERRNPWSIGINQGFCVVRERGVEPPRPCGHWHLKPARLPFRHSPECFWPLSDLFKIAHSRSIASNTLITAYFHPSSCAVYPPLPPTCRDTSPAAPTPSASHPPITHPTLAEDATLSATLTFTLRLSLTTLPPRLPLVFSFSGELT